MSAFYKKTISVLLTCFIVLSLYTPIVSERAVPYAEAAFATTAFQARQLVEEAWTAIKSTISAASDLITSRASFSLFVKEFILDGIAFNLAQLVLKQITASIVQWINSGFDGSPAFVTDLKGFLVDIADQETGKFIYGSELNFLCSPFELDIRIALALQYRAERDFTPQIQCTFTDAIGNLEGFLSGNFEDGGWAGWFELTQNPQNTPYGAYLTAQGELDVRIIDAQGRELAILDWGDGTFSKTLCELVHGDDSSRENCFINMPGKYIQEQLTFAIQSGQRSLIAADEINEIIGALFAQLAQQAITGANGILGLSQGGYRGGSGSYLDSMLFESSVGQETRFTVLEDALFIELDYRDLFVGIKEDVDSVEAENDANAIVYSGCYRLSLPRDLRNFRTDAIDGTREADIAIATLDLLIFELESGVTPQREQEIFNEFLDMRASGEIHTEVDIAFAELDLREFDSAIKDFQNDMDREVRRCESSGSTDGERTGSER